MRAEGLTGVSVTPSVVRISEVPACVVAMQVKASAQRIVARRSGPGAISSQVAPPSKVRSSGPSPANPTVGERKYTSRTAAPAWRTSAHDSAPSVVR